MKEIEEAVKVLKEMYTTNNMEIGLEDNQWESVRLLISLAETVLAFKGALPERKMHPLNCVVDCNCGGKMWNEAIDACLAAIAGRVPSRNEITEVVKKSELWRMSNYVGRDDSSYEGINGTDQLAEAIRSLLLERFGGK